MPLLESPAAGIYVDQTNELCSLMQVDLMKKDLFIFT